VRTPRIVALALIGILLSSSSVSLASGYTVWLDIGKINSINDQNYDQQFYNINLKDAVSASLSQKKFSDGSHVYKIKLFDSTSVFLNQPGQTDEEQLVSKIISVNLADGMQTKSIRYSDDNSKIVYIKHADVLSNNFIFVYM